MENSIITKVFCFFLLTLHVESSIAGLVGQGATSGGYFYTAQFYDPNNGMPIVQYMLVGPFATQEECSEHLYNEQIDNDNWFPHNGVNQCRFIFDTDLNAVNDWIDHHNIQPLHGNSANNPIPATGLPDQFMIESINNLRDTYNIEAYEEGLNNLIEPN